MLFSFCFYNEFKYVRSQGRNQTNIVFENLQTGFQLSSQSNSRLLCFCITALGVEISGQSIRSKTEINCDTFAHVSNARFLSYTKPPHNHFKKRPPHGLLSLRIPLRPRHAMRQIAATRRRDRLLQQIA